MNRVYIIGKNQVPQNLVVGAGESVDLTLVVLPGVSCDLSMSVDLVGEGADLKLSGLYVCGGDERVKISIVLSHKVAHCTSSQLFKGLVGGNARSFFHGRVIVEPDAQKTEAYQANHNLLLSDTAKAETQPQLEIYADDVKCSHGATVGRLNEDEQFYMRSRGISESEAKVLQMVSFVSPVLESISNPTEKESITTKVEDAIREMVR